MSNEENAVAVSIPKLWAGDVVGGLDVYQLLLRNWKELLEPSGLSRAPSGPFVLMQMPDMTWFTQIPKKGASVDTYDPEFRVVSIEKVGDYTYFYTASNYPVPIFRYASHEAQAVLSKEANAILTRWKSFTYWRCRKSRDLSRARVSYQDRSHQAPHSRGCACK